MPVIAACLIDSMPTRILSFNLPPADTVALGLEPTHTPAALQTEHDLRRSRSSCNHLD